MLDNLAAALTCKSCGEVILGFVVMLGGGLFRKLDGIPDQCPRCGKADAGWRVEVQRHVVH